MGIQHRFHPGQYRAITSCRRFVAVIAGTQSGKTSFGAFWLLNEIRSRGAGDYLVVTPTYPLLALKALPEFLRLFGSVLRLGDYVGSPVKVFRFSRSGLNYLFGSDAEPCNVYFGHAGDPDSLESATAKAAWLDEAGQAKFKFGSWQAVQRRLAIHGGRALITTTPYNLGWLKREVYDRWQAGDPLYDVIQFRSTMNPAFPKDEYERARRELPGWKLRMYYDGEFERPAGLVYDCFTDDRNTCPRFTIPSDWRRHLGLDFGGVNTAGVFLALEPQSTPPRYYAYREYHAGGRTAKQHAVELLRGEPGVPVCVGGSKSEGQWRDEFRAAGLPVREPAVADVEVGINRVWGGFNGGQVIVFSDLVELLDDVAGYSRETDDQGNPTEKIADKEAFHLADALRYIGGWLLQGDRTPRVNLPRPEHRNLVHRAPPGVFRPK